MVIRFPHPVCIIPRLRKCAICGRERRKDELFEMQSLDALACRNQIECHRLVAGGEKPQ